MFKNITFSTEIPAGFELAFESSVFHTNSHLKLQGEPFIGFFVLNDVKKKVLAHIYFHIQNEQAYSPFKASFGGIEMAQNLDLHILFEFIGFYEKFLKENRVKNILIKIPPAFFNITSYTKQQEVFLKNNYTIKDSEIAASIPVTKEPFYTHLSTNYKRRLNRLLKDLDYNVRELSKSHLQELYNFILNARTNKQQSLSMDLPDLKNTVDLLESNFKLFGLYKNNTLVAASISIVINKNIIYNFYSAHDEAYDKQSPILLLFDFLYKCSFQNNMTVLDLGTSAVDDLPNFSLLHFKEHLGAMLSPKLTFTKKLQ